MTDEDWIADDTRIFELAETLAAIAQPDLIRVSRALATGCSTSVGIGRREKLKRAEVEDVLWELVVSGLATGDKANDVWKLTELGQAVWRAVKELLALQPEVTAGGPRGDTSAAT